MARRSERREGEGEREGAKESQLRVCVVCCVLGVDEVRGSLMRCDTEYGVDGREMMKCGGWSALYPSTSSLVPPSTRLQDSGDYEYPPTGSLALVLGSPS